MATIDSKALVDQLIAAGGRFEDDPPVALIVEYTNYEGATTWGVTWVNEPPARQRRYLIETEYVRRPRQLWPPPADPPGLTRLPAQPCPLCGATLSAAGTMDGTAGAPSAGDWTVCAYCLQWLVYLDGGALRPVSDGEWLQLPAAERVQLTAQRETVRWAWAQRGQP